MKKMLLAIVAVFVLLPKANGTPGSVVGAGVFGVGAGVACDHLVRSHMETTPMSDEPWYFIWHHVGPEDAAGFAAGTVCAIPAAMVGGVVGLAVETSIVGASVAGAAASVGTATAVATGKGLQFASRVSAGSGKKALRRAHQRWGTLAFRSVAASTPLRKHMPDLYQKQKGIDALCGIPLPNLYVGWPWERRLNPLIEVDHIRPRSRGGSDKFANLQLTRREYNRAKGNLYGPALRRAKRNFCPI